MQTHPLDDVLSAVLDHPLARLGTRALLRMGAAPPETTDDEPTLSAKDRAAHQALLEQVIAAVTYNTEDLPAYPIALRPPLDWGRIQSCCAALAADGCNLEAYQWLCISAFYVDPRSCYTALAATLVSLNTLLGTERTWKELGLSAPLGAAATETVSPHQKKIRERLRKSFLALAFDLEKILDSIQSPPATPPPAIQRDEDHDERTLQKQRQAEAVYNAAQMARRQVALQGPEPMRRCAHAIRLLHECVSEWLGELTTLLRLCARLEPTRPVEPKPALRLATSPVVGPVLTTSPDAPGSPIAAEPLTERPATAEAVRQPEPTPQGEPMPPRPASPPTPSYQLPAPTPIPAELRSDLARLHKNAQQANSQRDAFMLRLDMAELCQREQRPDVAIPVLTALLLDAERFHLAEWEPSLLQRLLHTYLRFFQIPGLNLPADLRIRLLAALSRIDPLEIESV